MEQDWPEPCYISGAIATVSTAWAAAQKALKPSPSLVAPAPTPSAPSAGAAPPPEAAHLRGTPSPIFSEERERERECLRKLGDELQCAVCKELFVEASTIECGHSFCGPCIESWLSRDLTCPICRRAVTKPPNRSVCLDRTVEILIQLAEAESRKMLQDRKSQCFSKREKECAAQKKMETVLALAARRGVRVVDINKLWSEREQIRFRRGIEREQGIARETFCGLVGLTHEWVGRAGVDQLMVAARNLGVSEPKQHADAAPAFASHMCISKLRARLDMFIAVG